MPHVYLEYTAGVGDAIDVKETFRRLHHTLVEVSGLRLDLVKTRLVRYDGYFVGDCEDCQEFIHLNVSTVTGKAGDDEKRHTISSALLDVLADIFEPVMQAHKVDLSVQITEVPASGYVRKRSEALLP
ncbi:5-carboxymethyl-2-hydroxymuconate isomerase [Pseudomonas kairouanensis]|uniref:5-carboxymethyl-2-hydroxymuconate isomerase n=1 Tax=Pseudomonas kairouanensis TaxID=2293832 RepID=A0A4Z0AL64_9PSED|nr:5-carboxymethyl-2-hydroxymuconate isomerase [Pseudomonas kairouanensis]TFY86728.1 5-carboxymethyl-2-hydroxymuconate isomerase [Pseudomonas kairouanensis]